MNKFILTVCLTVLWTTYLRGQATVAYSINEPFRLGTEFFPDGVVLEVGVNPDFVDLGGNYFNANNSFINLSSLKWEFYAPWAGDVELLINTSTKKAILRLKYEHTEYSTVSLTELNSIELARIRERQKEEQERRLQEIELERQRQEKERFQIKLFNKYIKTSDSLAELTNFEEALKFLTMAEGLELKPTDKVNPVVILNDRNKQLKERIEFENLRRTKVYSLAELDNNQYNTIRISLKNIIYSKVLPQIENDTISMAIQISIDTNGVIQYTISGLEKHPDLLRQLSKELDKSLVLANHAPVPDGPNELKVPMPRIIKFNKFLFYETEYFFEVQSIEKTAVFKVTENRIISLENNAQINVERYGPKDSYPNGLYYTTIVESRINNIDYYRVKSVYYKSIDGPANALYTGILPWKGYKEVAGKVNTLNSIAPLALFSIATMFKLSSNSNYNRYLSAVDMNDVSRYYNSANNQHKIAIISGSGAIIYSVYNMGWVYLRGLRNKKSQRQFLKQNPQIQKWTRSSSPSKDINNY